VSIVHRTNPKNLQMYTPVNLYARFALAPLFFKHSVYFRWGRCSLRSHGCRVCDGYATSFGRKATIARGSNVRTRAYPFRRASFVFCERLFFCLSTRSTRQHSRKRYARTIGGKLALLARARSRTRFAHVIGGPLSPRAFIGQEFFGNFVKRCMALSQSRAPFERVKTRPQNNVD